jgi:hypothetical protein
LAGSHTGVSDKGVDISWPLSQDLLLLGWSIGAVTESLEVWRQKGDMLMFRTRLLLLSLVAALSAVALLASSASAKIAFEWKVNGKALATGENRTFTASAESNFDLHGKVAGFETLLLATKLKVEPGAKLFGGKPGTNEETVVFEGVTVDDFTGCEVESLPNPVPGTVRTLALKTEIVEGQTSHEPLILFTPKAGTVFTELRFLGSACTVKNQEASVTGSVLADPLPRLTEVLTGLLNFEPSQGNVFLLSTGGAADTAGLIFAGNTATLGGNALVTLVSDEKFGAF